MYLIQYIIKSIASKPLKFPQLQQHRLARIFPNVQVMINILLVAEDGI